MAREAARGPLTSSYVSLAFPPQGVGNPTSFPTGPWSSPRAVKWLVKGSLFGAALGWLLPHHHGWHHGAWWPLWVVNTLVVMVGSALANFGFLVPSCNGPHPIPLALALHS
uniref:Uncharacterized protein n=1 Tax=Solanum tuberosum TaxID=4113 RepID=M1D8J7_SOLTU